MITKYDSTIDAKSINEYLHKLKNQIFKLLPLREENSDWEKWLETLMIEINGVDRVLMSQVDFLRLLGKLEMLPTFSKSEFHIYRKTIFECINLVDSMKV